MEFRQRASQMTHLFTPLLLRQSTSPDRRLPLCFFLFFFHDNHIHWVNKGYTFNLVQCNIYIYILYCMPSFLPCHLLMVVQLAFRGYRVLVSLPLSAIHSCFFLTFFLTQSCILPFFFCQSTLVGEHN